MCSVSSLYYTSAYEPIRLSCRAISQQKMCACCLKSFGGRDHRRCLFFILYFSFFIWYEFRIYHSAYDLRRVFGHVHIRGVKKGFSGII
jgi:hypothetical protein